MPGTFAAVVATEPAQVISAETTAASDTQSCATAHAFICRSPEFAIWAARLFRRAPAFLLGATDAAQALRDHKSSNPHYRRPVEVYCRLLFMSCSVFFGVGGHQESQVQLEGYETVQLVFKDPGSTKRTGNEV